MQIFRVDRNETRLVIFFLIFNPPFLWKLMKGLQWSCWCPAPMLNNVYTLLKPTQTFTDTFSMINSINLKSNTWYNILLFGFFIQILFFSPFLCFTSLNLLFLFNNVLNYTSIPPLLLDHVFLSFFHWMKKSKDMAIITFIISVHFQ